MFNGAYNGTLYRETNTSCLAQTEMGGNRGDSGNGWCAMDRTTSLINIVLVMIYDNTNKFQLPHNIYYVCGLNAYKWLPYGEIGACTLAKIDPATWVWENIDLPYRQLPKHLLYKRNTIPKAKEQVSLP